MKLLPLVMPALRSAHPLTGVALCSQCRFISLSSLTSAGGFLLHHDHSSLSRSAATCELCKLISQRLGEAIEKESQDPRSWRATEDYSNAPVSLSYSHPVKDADDLAAAREGRPRKIRKKPTEFSSLNIRLGYPEKAERKPTIHQSILTYVHPGDPLSSLGFQERNVLTADPLAESGVSRVRSWMENCADNHPECRRDDTVTAVLPKRLLSLQNIHQSGILTVEEVPSDFVSDYFCLSYCWGPTRDQRWLDYVCEIQSQHKAVELALMPKTLRDAVAVTLAFGYTYLWIDCLCILQGDAADWRTESAKMSDIYEGAALTISASDTADCRDGFLSPRDNLHAEGVPLKLTTEDGRTGTLRVSAHEHDNSFAATVRRGPVSSRAWCLQERRLTSRVLHMCHAQTCFECVKSRHFESEVEAEDEFMEGEFELFHIPRDDGQALNRGKPSGRVQNTLQWYGIVEDYMTRKLTMASDKLVAIAGLAQSANRNLRSRYLAGLWEKQIHVGLCWTLPERGKALARCNEYRAPSWSWASVDGPVSWLVDWWVQSEDGFLEAAIELVNAEMDLDEASPYGQVRGGSLTVSGRLKTISTEVLQENEILTYPRWMSGTTPYLGYYMEDEMKTLEGELNCFKVALRPFGPGPSIPPTNCMLVLDPLGSNTYRRLGYGQVMQTDFFDQTPIQMLRLL